jgi:hypothetical protein
VYKNLYIRVYVYIYQFSFFPQPTARPLLEQPVSLVPTVNTIQPSGSGQPTTIIPDGLGYDALTFSATLSMPGQDSEGMVASDQLAFRTAIASSMEGVRPIDVTFVSALPMISRRKLNMRNVMDRSDTESEMSHNDYFSRSLQVLTGSAITCNVSVPLSRLGTTSGSAAYQSLTAGLQKAMGPEGAFLPSIKILSASFKNVNTSSVEFNAFKIVSIVTTSAPTSSPTITAVIPSITLNVTAFRTNVTLSIVLDKAKIVATDISGM